MLTRLPAPHRAAAALVQEFLADRFRRPYLMLDPDEFRVFLEELPPLGIAGGAAYDALIASVARDAGATLVTCDRRAADVYGRPLAVAYSGIGRQAIEPKVPGVPCDVWPPFSEPSC